MFLKFIFFEKLKNNKKNMFRQKFFFGSKKTGFWSKKNPIMQKKPYHAKRPYPENNYGFLKKYI